MTRLRISAADLLAITVGALIGVALGVTLAEAWLRRCAR